MLTKFKVSNFKSFNTEFVFDLQNSNGYTFNNQSIKNGVVNNALVYGYNGVGKSNLGLAIFDIIGHLTDNQTDDIKYMNYLNAESNSEYATFYYEFLFEGITVLYQYKKLHYKSILSEKITINGKELAFINRAVSNDAKVLFKGAESLKTELPFQNLSLLKYIRNNSVLEKNLENDTLERFFNFIDGMLFFRNLQDNTYFGLLNGSRNIEEDIINRGKLIDFELFLNTAGITCKLNAVKELNKDTIVFNFNGKTIPFFDTASSGTIALTFFYFWLQRLRDESNVSFVFIDEFDAFYHHELSALIIEELKKTDVQFILTTHNTSNISNDILRPDCYFLMYKDSIRSLAKRTSKELREAHNIEKMYKAGSFNE